MSLKSQSVELALATKINSDGKKLSAASQPIVDDDDFPEGGLRGWMTVFGVFLIQFCGFGYTTSFGVYQDFYTRIFITNQTTSTISWIGSVNAFIVTSLGIISGKLFDRGYFRYLLYGGFLLSSFSIFMLSLCKPDSIYQNFLSQGVGYGLGAGLLYVPSIAIIAHYFKRRRAMAMAISTTGSSLGAIVFPLMLNNTIDGPLGFANATRASAALVCGALFIACFLVHPRLPPPTVPPSFHKSFRDYSRDQIALIATAAIVMATMALYFPIDFLQLDTIQHGLSPNFGFYALVIMNFSSMIGRIFPALVVGYIGVVNLVIIATAGYSFVILGMVGLKSVTSVVLVAIFYGFFSGLFNSITGPFIAVITDDLSELGARMGFIYALCGVSALIGPPISGALLSRNYSWWKPAVFSGLCGIIGFAILIPLGIMIRRKEMRQEDEITNTCTDDAKA